MKEAKRPHKASPSFAEGIPLLLGGHPFWVIVGARGAVGAQGRIPGRGQILGAGSSRRERRPKLSAFVALRRRLSLRDGRRGSILRETAASPPELGRRTPPCVPAPASRRGRRAPAPGNRRHIPPCPGKARRSRSRRRRASPATPCPGAHPAKMRAPARPSISRSSAEISRASCHLVFARRIVVGGLMDGDEVADHDARLRFRGSEVGARLPMRRWGARGEWRREDAFQRIAARISDMRRSIRPEKKNIAVKQERSGPPASARALRETYAKEARNRVRDRARGLSRFRAGLRAASCLSDPSREGADRRPRSDRVLRLRIDTICRVLP